MDTKTKQLFAEPGPGRISLGKFVPADEARKEPSISSTPNAATVPAPPANQEAKVHWYDKMSVRGYTQFRHTTLLTDENKDDRAGWFHPADKSVGDHETLLIRRARLVLSGDASEHLYFYLQPEFNATASDGSSSSVQLRDAYSDIALDPKKEWRVRAGQSKVPYGFEDLQSSQNRLALERTEGVNNAVEGERDLGVYLMWAPAEIRERFRYLVSSGLKGSGDYGVVAIGGYNGQGINRVDQNDELHTVARVSYPFKFANGQFFEPGIQAYTGKYVPKTSSITLDDGSSVTPTYGPGGVTDQRVGVSAVIYPQPFGLESEWNVGQGPDLNEDFTAIQSNSISGGYVLGSYKLDFDGISVLPFVRWQYLDGGRKFGTNSPHANLNEWDFGVEWSPWKEIEMTAQYSFSKYRTNTNQAPYDEIENAHRLAVQLQWNY